jgi:hypothetical protein
VHLAQPDRGIELARTLGDPVRRTQALAAVAEALHERGDRPRAPMIADDAVACAGLIPDPRTAATERCALVGTLAEVAGPQAVLALADDVARGGHAQPELVAALARVGLYERAEAIARTLPDSTAQARALVCVWTACSDARLVERARSLAAQIGVRGLPDYAAAALRGPTPDRRRCTTSGANGSCTPSRPMTTSTAPKR